MDTVGGEPGAWVPLRLLRQLPLPFPAYHELIASLRRQSVGATPQDSLVAELTEASATALREALEGEDLDNALAAHDHLLGHVIELAAARPEMASLLWQRYGALLGRLTGQVHERLVPRNGEPVDFSANERAGDAALCLRMARMLAPTSSQPWDVPNWLPVLEQKLVQHGALAWNQRIGTDPSAAEPCLDMVLRLSQLLDPVPAWVEQMCRTAMTKVIEGLPAAGALTEQDLALLIRRVGRLPVAPERREGFEAALLRARFSLELMEHGRTTSRRSGSRGTEALEAEWLEDGEDVDEPPPALPLRLVAAAADPVAAEEFCLEPFLDGDGDGAVAALDAFLTPWLGSQRSAFHPITSLVESLAPPGRPLSDGALQTLCRAVVLWQERLGPQMAALPPVVWRSGALVVELDPLELLVLRHAAGAAENLEEALAELRRRHHDRAFWGAAAAPVFPTLPEALEVLRRFEAEAGFYAATQAPLESLRHWARPALQALLQAQVWSVDPATQALWLPWALEGGAGQLRQPPSGSGLLERLGGGEVVLVGEGPEATEALLAAHRDGRLFVGGAFGLRCLAVPESRHPHRPAAGFASSLEELVGAVEQLYRERPFTVLLTTGGSYRLPLAQAIVSRYGVLAVALASPVAAWLEGDPPMAGRAVAKEPVAGLNR
jgi:hypothetical protein